METSSENTSVTSAGPQAEQKHFVDSPWFDIAGVVTAGVAAVLAAWHAAHRNFQNRFLSKMGIISDLESKKDKALRLLGVSDPKAGGKAHLVGKDLVDEEQRILKEYHQAKATRLKERGIHTRWRKLSLLDKYGKMEVAIEVGAVTAVAIGAFITLSSMLRLSKKQEKLQQRLDAMENSPQR